MASPERNCVNDGYGANTEHGYGEQSLDLIPLEKVIMQLDHASPCMVCERSCGRGYAARQDRNATFRSLWEVQSCHYWKGVPLSDFSTFARHRIVSNSRVVGLVNFWSWPVGRSWSLVWYGIASLSWSD